MPKDPQEFADLLGARIVGEVPDGSGGPFGMARLAHIMHQRFGHLAADPSATIGHRPDSSGDCVLGTQHGGHRVGAVDADTESGKPRIPGQERQA